MTGQIHDGCKILTFSPKVEIFTESRDFRRKSRFSPKVEFRRKSRISAKILHPGENLPRRRVFEETGIGRCHYAWRKDSTPTCKTGCIKTKTFSVIKQTFLVIKPCSTETVSKKICGPSARKFFSREIFGAASVSPCAGRNLRRRVLAEICAAVCWPKIWRKSAPPCCVVIFDALVLHVSVAAICQLSFAINSSV